METEPQDNSSPERCLWLGVILQAFVDMEYPYRGEIINGRATTKNAARLGGNMMHAKQAKDWLTGKTRDFNMICALAGVDPACVRERARLAIWSYENAYWPEQYTDSLQQQNGDKENEEKTDWRDAETYWKNDDDAVRENAHG